MFLFVVSSINNILIFINILLLVRRKFSKPSQRHRSKKRLRTTGLNFLEAWWFNFLTLYKVARLALKIFVAKIVSYKNSCDENVALKHISYLNFCLNFKSAEGQIFALTEL